jgi:hypothetical protein
MNLKPAPIAEIAANLAASPAFDWIPGMLAILPEDWQINGGTCLRVTETGAIPPAGAFPDLTDGATRGAILDLVRAAWADPTICPYRVSDQTWEVYSEASEELGDTWPVTFDHPEEGGALALALLGSRQPAP